MVLITGEIPDCPHCQQSQNDPIEDFVLPGLNGPSYHRCDQCKKKYKVKKVGVTKYELIIIVEP